jgi:hypothetical protein
MGMSWSILILSMKTPRMSHYPSVAEAYIFTLGDARTMRIQWKKCGILTPPLVGRQLLKPKSGHLPVIAIN